MDKIGCKKIISYLVGFKEDGSDVIGVYPLLPNGTCRFIVFDFDNHEKGAEATDFANTDNEWHKEVDALFNKTEKLGIEDIEQCMAKWQGELAEARGMLANVDKNTRPKPWKKKYEFCKSDVVGRLHMVLSNGVYIDTLNLMPRIQNQIRSLAAFDNSDFTSKEILSCHWILCKITGSFSR